MSNGPLASKPRRRSSIKITKKVDDVDVGKATPHVPTAAEFGWTSNTTLGKDERKSSQTKRISSQSSHQVSDSVSNITSVREPTSSASTQPLPSNRASPEPIPTSSDPLPQNAAVEDKSKHNIPSSVNVSMPRSVLSEVVVDADDDWGEMISSPVVVSAPKLPLQPLITESQNAGSILPVIAPTPVTSQALDKDNLGIGNLDQLVMPGTSSVNGAGTSPAVATANSPFEDIIFSSSQKPTSQPVSGSDINPSLPQPSNGDVWASADFSFFDSAPEPVPVPTPKTKAVSTTAQVASASATSSSKRSKEELEQDKIVEGILKNLPDLSYMLKR